MADIRDFLVEIGCEELPPNALRRLAEAFHDGLVERLTEADLLAGAPESEYFFSPRRLAVRVPGVASRQPDRTEERVGPPVQAAFDADGNPTKAAEGFARSCGTTVDALVEKDTDKGRRIAATVEHAGRDAGELLPEAVDGALGALPVPKRMRWSDRDETFVRPVHWLVMLLGETVVDTTLFGVPAGRMTHGHRIHSAAPIELQSAADYPARLRDEGRVVVNDRHDTLGTRMREIVAAAAEATGGRAHMTDELVAEVAALVEWPVPVTGHFEERFLELPDEVLIATLEDHQRYFPVLDADGGLKPCFIAVSNIESREPDQVRRGNERVVRPRLDDSMFFWSMDRQRTLAARVADLDRVIFQKKLGTVGDKTRRVTAIAKRVAALLELDEGNTTRAAELAKTDLLTEMVGEFPELQGIMGHYYALADGEPATVARALEEQYRPRFAGDTVPETGEGAAIAIADKLDTITGIFAIGQKPTGNKDPFALRRNGLGLLRIMIERELPLSLPELVATAVDELGEKLVGDREALVDEVLEFLFGRLRAYYQERGMRVDVFEAVLSRRPEQPLDFDRRVRAVTQFLELEAAGSLAAANKRIRNILRQAGGEVGDATRHDLFREDEERALHAEIDRLEGEVRPLLQAGRYGEALTRLAALREPVDRFFDEVMVMTDDDAVRKNRLALLKALSDLFRHTADLSAIQSG